MNRKKKKKTAKAIAPISNWFGEEGLLWLRGP
jgi:hypothetical protein